MKTILLILSLNFFSCNDPSYNIWVTGQRIRVLHENYGKLNKAFFLKQFNSILYNVITGYRKQCNLKANRYVFPLS